MSCRTSSRIAPRSGSGASLAVKFASFVAVCPSGSLATTDMLLSVSAVSGGALGDGRPIVEKTTVHSVLLLPHAGTGMYAWPLQGVPFLEQLARSHSVSSYVTGRPGGWVMAFGHFTVTLSRFAERLPSRGPLSNRIPGLNTTGALVLTWYTDRCTASSNTLAGMRFPHHSKLVFVSKHATLVKLPSFSFWVHPLSLSVGGSPSWLIGCVG